MKESIAVLGTGHVGMVASVCLADFGHEVTALDIDTDRIQKIQSGELPLYEPGLQELYETNTQNGNLQFSSNWSEELLEQDIVMITVGTPKREDGSCDISYVMNAAEMIGQTVESKTLVVTKSTVPVGTGELVKERIYEQFHDRFHGSDKPDVRVASNPEFLREGSAIGDFMNPDRIVIGASRTKDKEFLASVYDPLDAPIVKTELRIAEMVKYASNAMLSTKISFVNEIANVCEEVGADVGKVAEGMGLDSRINREFLNAGVGYGGSSFPKDNEALVQIAGQRGYDSKILSSVMAVNRQQSIRFARKIIRKVSDLSCENPTIGILGLSYKPDTDDMREAPSIDVIQELQLEGFNIKAYDPVALEYAREKLSGVKFVSDPYAVAENSNAVALITEWSEFLELDFERFTSAMEDRLIFDGRNVLPYQKLKDLGCEYYGVGRGDDRLEDVLTGEKLLSETNEGVAS